MREQILDRGRDALQRTGARTDGEGGIGRLGAFARMLGRPLRIGQELAAETLVIGDRLVRERARFELAFAEQDRDLDDRKRQCIGHGGVPCYSSRRSESGEDRSTRLRLLRCV